MYVYEGIVAGVFKVPQVIVSGDNVSGNFDISTNNKNGIKIRKCQSILGNVKCLY